MSATPAPISVSELAAWLAEQNWSSFALSVAQAYQKYGKLSEKQEASARSMYAKSQARQAVRKAEAPANPVVEMGMYILDDVIFRVKQSQAGRLYAMRYNPQGADRGSRFIYEGGAMRRLSADNRMTVEQAREIGALVGQCCVCGRELIVEKNVLAGIGPVCVNKI